ncbi:MAG: phosphoesterase [Pirellulaceae bacterium]|nr:MAG: phosphoesterase [Pirellulaceae bacterium]
MSGSAWILVGFVAIAGHVAFWLDFFRRFAASNVPCYAVRWVERLVWAACLTIPLLIVLETPWLPPDEGSSRQPVMPWGLWYLWLAGLYGVWRAMRWGFERLVFPRPITDPQWQRVVRLEPAGRWAGTVTARCWLALPANEVCQIELNEKHLSIPRLPSGLDGLVILHLSDLHMHPQWKRDYFEHVARLAAEKPVDVVVVTGDIVETADCLAWVQVWLCLKPQYGFYFVLGNHDLRAGPPEMIRQKLTSLGWTSVGGRRLRVRWRDEWVVLTGNESPWIRLPPECDGPVVHDGLSVALLHTPDQFAWARRLGFDLVLAGHTHGGQVRVPGWGPLVVPCHTGTRYAAGVYYEQGSVLHVSRGLSSLHLLRWGCRPEVTRLVLHQHKL